MSSTRWDDVLSLQKVTLQFGTSRIVTHCSQDFAPGQRWCVMGPNGAGKTTFIQMLAGLRVPQKGQISLAGRSLSDWPLIELARRRAWMPQIWQDAFPLSVMECLLFAQYPYCKADGPSWYFWKKDALHRYEAAQHRVRTILEILELTSFATRSVNTLSGGERQRVALAAALCQDTPFLLLDEPFAHMDIPHQLNSLRVLRAHCEVQAAHGAGCVIFSSHDFYTTRLFATHVLLLDGLGGVVAGPVHEVLTAQCVSRAFGHPFRLIEDPSEGLAFLMPVL